MSNFTTYEGDVLVLIHKESNIPYLVSIVDKKTENYFTTEMSQQRWSNKTGEKLSIPTDNITSYMTSMKPVIFNESIEIDEDYTIDVNNKTFKYIKLEEAINNNLIDKNFIEKYEDRIDIIDNVKSKNGLIPFERLQQETENLQNKIPNAKDITIKYDDKEEQIIINYKAQPTTGELSHKVFSEFKEKMVEFIYETKFKNEVSNTINSIEELTKKLKEKEKELQEKEESLNIPKSKRFKV